MSPYSYADYSLGDEDEDDKKDKEEEEKDMLVLIIFQERALLS